MDGYAVVASSTEGAGPYSRLPLTVIGDSMPGRPFDGALAAGEAVRVMTGAPLPQGADAVVPAEFVDAESGSDTTIVPGPPRVVGGLTVFTRRTDSPAAARYRTHFGWS